MTRPLAVALCDDFAEERWPSMDRVAGTLAARLASAHRTRVEAARVCPPFVYAATRLPVLGAAAAAAKADRFLNRFWRYPHHASSLRDRFDLFHVVDHSYAHLVNALPAKRTVVTCHDLDAFRPLIEPDADPRSGPFRSMTQRIATGLGRAAHVMCDTGAIAHDLVSARLADPARVSVVPLGVDARFFMDENGIDETGVDLLHVGSTVMRKRIDLLLRLFSAVAASEPTARLIRIGDPLTDAQRQLARELQIADRIVELRDVDEDTLVACYRRAVLVLQPSDREGFGLPVVEALASGTPVVASDLPVLREVGGDAVTFCPAGDVDVWARTVSGLLRERAACAAKWQARRQAGRDRARRFTWDRFADEVVRVYEQVAVASR